MRQLPQGYGKPNPQTQARIPADSQLGESLHERTRVAARIQAYPKP